MRLGPVAFFIFAFANACGDGAASRPDAGSSHSPDAGSAHAPGRCASTLDCDDGLECTRDDCLVGGVCRHEPDDRKCGAGERCIAGAGCRSGRACGRDTDCNDGVSCTEDVCLVGGVCENHRRDDVCTMGQVCSQSRGCIAAGTCGSNGDCDDGAYCNGAETCVMGRCQPGSAVTCDDADACTFDRCREATRSCEHAPLSPCGGGAVTAGTYMLAPSAQSTCGAGSYRVDTITLALSGTSLTVTGAPTLPVMLSGTTSGAMFTASGSAQGVCTVRYALTGTFLAPDHFSGALTASYDDCDALLGCGSAHTDLVEGRRAP